MCVRIYNRDTQKEAESPQELREMLSITELIMAEGYKTTPINEDCCLCQIDCEGTVKAAGYTYTEVNGDYMDVEISKAPAAAMLPEDSPKGGTGGTELYRRMLGEDYRDPKISALMLEVWSPTPWMLDVMTAGREQEMWLWCYHNFGGESSPIHGHEGGWHLANVTLHGKTWFGFRTEAMMKRFQEKFPTTEMAAPLANTEGHEL